jgi:hypothetical protein
MICFAKVYQVTSDPILAGQKIDDPGSFCIFPPDSIQANIISFTELTEIKLKNFLIRCKEFDEKTL